MLLETEGRRGKREQEGGSSSTKNALVAMPKSLAAERALLLVYIEEGWAARTGRAHRPRAGARSQVSQGAPLRPLVGAHSQQPSLVAALRHEGGADRGRQELSGRFLAETSCQSCQ